MRGSKADTAMPDGAVSLTTAVTVVTLYLVPDSAGDSGAGSIGARLTLIIRKNVH